MVQLVGFALEFRLDRFDFFGRRRQVLLLLRQRRFGRQRLRSDSPAQIGQFVGLAFQLAGHGFDAFENRIDVFADDGRAVQNFLDHIGQFVARIGRGTFQNLGLFRNRLRRGFRLRLHLVEFFGDRVRLFADGPFDQGQFVACLRGNGRYLLRFFRQGIGNGGNAFDRRSRRRVDFADVGVERRFDVFEAGNDSFDFAVDDDVLVFESFGQAADGTGDLLVFGVKSLVLGIEDGFDPRRAGVQNVDQR